MKAIRIVSLLAINLLLLPLNASELKVGDKVMPKMDAKLKQGTKNLSWQKFALPLTVRKIQDDWLWIGGAKVKSDHVVPLADALGYYTEYLRDNPQSSAAYNNRGIAWSETKSYYSAIKDYTKAIKIDPNHAAAYNNRGNAWAEKEEYDNAIEDFTQAIKLDPKYVMAYKNRGLAWRLQGEYDRAIKNYTEAIKLSPKYVTIYNDRAIVWKLKGEYGNVIEDYTEVVKLDPNNKSCHNNLAWLYATCPESRYRNGKKAVEHARKACELTDWKNDSEIDTLSAAYAEAGDFEKAIRFLDKAMKMAPEKHKVARQKMMNLFKEGTPYRDQPITRSSK